MKLLAIELLAMKLLAKRLLSGVSEQFLIAMQIATMKYTS